MSVSIQPLGCGPSSWMALALWCLLTTVGWVFHNRLGISCYKLFCLDLVTALFLLMVKTLSSKIPSVSHNHKMLQRGLVLEPLLLVCKGPKKLVHIDFNLLLKGVWGYLTAPKPTTCLLCISCIWCRRPGSGALPSTYGCLSVTSFQHTCCKHMSHLSWHFHHQPCQRSDALSRKREDSQLKLHHKSLGNGRNGEKLRGVGWCNTAMQIPWASL